MSVCSRCKGSGLDDASGFGDFIACGECGGSGTPTFSRWLEKVREEIPGVNIRPASPPFDKTGLWMTDVDLNLRTVCLQWRPFRDKDPVDIRRFYPDGQYGVSLLDAPVFQSKPDFVYGNADEATDQVKAFLLGSRSNPWRNTLMKS